MHLPCREPIFVTRLWMARGLPDAKALRKQTPSVAQRVLSVRGESLHETDSEGAGPGGPSDAMQYPLLRGVRGAPVTLRPPRPLFDDATQGVEQTHLVDGSASRADEPGARDHDRETLGP